MRRAVVGAVLALAISACGGTTQSPAGPVPPSTVPPTTSAPATLASEPPASPSLAPSQAALVRPSRPPGGSSSRATAPAPERTIRGRSTRPREPRTCSVAATARRCTTTSGHSISRPTPGVSLTPAARGPAPRFGHEAVWIDGVGLVVWAGQAGPTSFFDDLWAYDPQQTTGHASRTTGRSRSRVTARVRPSGPTGGYGSATGSPRTASGSRTRAPTTSTPAGGPTKPLMGPSPWCAACTRAG